jgi:hypothetical protein
LTGEDRSKSAVPCRIGNNDFFRWDLYGLLKIESPFRVAFRSSRGRESADIVGRTLPELRAALAARDPQPKTTADLKFPDDGNIAVLTIRSFEEYVDPQQKLRWTPSCSIGCGGSDAIAKHSAFT